MGKLIIFGFAVMAGTAFASGGASKATPECSYIVHREAPTTVRSVALQERAVFVYEYDSGRFWREWPSTAGDLTPADIVRGELAIWSTQCGGGKT